MSTQAPTGTATDHAPLGEILVRRGVLTEEDLSAALAHQRETGSKLGHALVELELCTELEIAEALDEQGLIPAIDLKANLIDQEICRELGAELSWRHAALAINSIGGITTVAMEDPSETTAVDDIGRHLGTPIFAVHAGPASIRECLEQIFPRGFEESADLDVVVAGCDDFAASLSQKNSDDIERFDRERDGETTPVVQLVRGIIEDACQSRASDVHIEPRRQEMVVRYRVDGSVYERCRFAKTWLRPLMSRLKIMAGLDITQRRLPQDGRILTEINGRRIDLRVSTARTLEGEGAAIRVFDGGRQIIGLEQLGFDSEQLMTLRQAVASRDGFILATGPSGSGKTTSLYGILRELNREDRKIVTLEDPVESQLEEAFQLAVNPKIGFDFQMGLKSVLRLDPDIIMIGEIRDAVAAKTAITASLTGHLVLSSLATIGTAETVMRLGDLGVDRFLIADTMRAIVSQRLVRRLCRNCKRPVTPPARLLEALGLEGEAAEGPFFEGRGCDECHQTGYRGRLALCEIMTMTPEIYDLVSAQSSSGELWNRARQLGMKSLRDDGLAKAARGQTSLEEVFAVTGGRSFQ